MTSFIETSLPPLFPFFFFFNDTATTEIYTLSLHDALPISRFALWQRAGGIATPLATAIFAFLVAGLVVLATGHDQTGDKDRKSTRLNSSHSQISYAVFCLKKKKKNTI